MERTDGLSNFSNYKWSKDKRKSANKFRKKIEYKGRLNMANSFIAYLYKKRSKLKKANNR